MKLQFSAEWTDDILNALFSVICNSYFVFYVTHPAFLSCRKGVSIIIIIIIIIILFIV
jgi:hypothetical protein